MSDESERKVRALYAELIAAWNRRDAAGMARLMRDRCTMIGFDGSEMKSPAEIESALGRIFRDHPTAAYVTIVREVRVVHGDVALLRADVGMVPPGQADIKPEVNALQVLLAVRDDEGWRIESFQNTPAAFHGRPEDAQKLSDELRAALKAETTTRLGPR